MVKRATYLLLFVLFCSSVFVNAMQSSEEIIDSGSKYIKVEKRGCSCVDVLNCFCGEKTFSEEDLAALAKCEKDLLSCSDSVFYTAYQADYRGKIESLLSQLSDLKKEQLDRMLGYGLYTADEFSLLKLYVAGREAVIAASGVRSAVQQVSKEQEETLKCAEKMLSGLEELKDVLGELDGRESIESVDGSNNSGDLG